ncbi:MAG: glycosyltransferase [Gallionellaceae bacterium]
MKKEAQASSLFAHFPVTVIPYSLDTDVFKPVDEKGIRSALGIPQKAKVVFFAADSIVNRRKGFAELVQALASLKLEEEIFFLTIGNDALELGAGFNHLHIGHVGNDRLLAAIYNAADVFVIPSLQEAFGQTALEAIACGTPVVGFDVGGIPDIVRPGITGSLAPQGDISGLRLAIAQLLSDSGKLREMGISCRRVAEEEYRLDIQARRYIELYERMLA